jgi:hypothetical protein
MVEASPRGRPISWLWVFLMLAFFIVGGFGLAAGSWPVFWVGVGGFLIAGVVSVFTGILRDVH